MIAREIARNIARTNLKDAGYSGFNRKQEVAGDNGNSKKRSYFSRHWREWVKREER